MLHLLLATFIIATELLALHDEDPGLPIESFAIIKLRGVTTKFKIHLLTLTKYLTISYYN